VSVDLAGVEGGPVHIRRDLRAHRALQREYYYHPQNGLRVCVDRVATCGCSAIRARLAFLFCLAAVADGQGGGANGQGGYAPNMNNVRRSPYAWLPPGLPASPDLWHIPLRAVILRGQAVHAVELAMLVVLAVARRTNVAHVGGVCILPVHASSLPVRGRGGEAEEEGEPGPHSAVTGTNPDAREGVNLGGTAIIHGMEKAGERVLDTGTKKEQSSRSARFSACQ